MNFYTLEYDCNTPVTQQINVPTNTDYMVGIKVKKDGEAVDISPSNITVGDFEMDAEKTNGYVTYKASTGDDASFRQFDVRVDTLMDAIDSSDLSSLSVTITKRTNKVNPSVPANVLSSMVGKTLYCQNVFIQYSMDNETWYDIDYAKAYEFQLSFWVMNDAGQYFYKWESPDRKWEELNEDEVIDYVDSIVIEDRWRFYSFGMGGNNFPALCPNWTGPSTPTADVPLYTRVIYKFGDGEIHQTFKLNLNAHKSQKGDINIVERASTVNFAGTDGQGNPFSYDIIVK